MSQYNEKDLQKLTKKQLISLLLQTPKPIPAPRTKKRPVPALRTKKVDRILDRPIENSEPLPEPLRTEKAPITISKEPKIEKAPKLKRKLGKIKIETKLQPKKNARLTDLQRKVKEL